MSITGGINVILHVKQNKTKNSELAYQQNSCLKSRFTPKIILKQHAVLTLYAIKVGILTTFICLLCYHLD
jgi:hypothetical protein